MSDQPYEPEIEGPAFEEIEKEDQDPDTEED